MEPVTHISKSALIAALNDSRPVSRQGARVVDCYYRVVPEDTRLILVMSDGTEKVFEGLRAA